ncbi:DeoR/GlpR family DNA-binding transcription regulator [Pseudacidovorax intermedius]|uniref:DeoR/GlpR family DNA-binding transcription regulator n=1 Tax=Pseudacidovorax intermedius TaxID=433924 RepID=UPI0026EC30D9|nr:DeoR/GlpR family DNA-binding transcription regulator [Pseudacidovorax intermedius]
MTSQTSEAEPRFPSERAKAITTLLREQGRVVASELAQRFAVSEDSIRRDLRDLAAKGACQRVYGGAVLPVPAAVPFQRRVEQDRSLKGDLAALACTLLQPGQLVFLDAGSTNLEIARRLPANAGLTVVTNSPQIAIAAAQQAGARVVLVGGDYCAASGAVVGAQALAQVQRLRVDVGVPGVCAVDAATGIWALDPEDAALKRAVVAASARVIVMASADKLGAQGYFHVAPLSELDDMVVDRLAPPFHRQAFADAGLAVHQVGQ